MLEEAVVAKRVMIDAIRNAGMEISNMTLLRRWLLLSDSQMLCTRQHLKQSREIRLQDSSRWQKTGNASFSSPVICVEDVIHEIVGIELTSVWDRQTDCRLAVHWVTATEHGLTLTVCCNVLVV